VDRAKAHGPSTAKPEAVAATKALGQGCVVQFYSILIAPPFTSLGSLSTSFYF
jgi:hypothetical protein